MAFGRSLVPSTSLREDLKAASIEVIGTTVFLYLAMGAIQSANLTVVREQGLEIAQNGPHSLERNIYISASAGVSLLGSAWMFYRTTGGLFNPAVSLALRLIGQLSNRRFIFYVIAQLIGSIVASALLLALSPSPLLIRSKLGEGTSLVQGVFIEMSTTSILILAILMLAAEKSQATPMAPIGISMTLFACHMYSIALTGTSLNPARTFGPAVISGFTSDHWVYWVGPLSGSCLSVAFYAWLKHTRYWDINPDQMKTTPKSSPEDPVREVERDVHNIEQREQSRHEGNLSTPVGVSHRHDKSGDLAKRGGMETSRGERIV